MKILLLGAYPPPHGGVQSHVVGLRQYLQERGISLRVINLTRHRRPDTDDVYYPQSSLQVVRLLFQLPYDIAHLHVGGDLAPRLLGLGLICCSVPGKKAVLTFHSGGYPSSPRGRAANPFTPQAFVLRRFDRLIGVNQEIVDFYGRCGVPRFKSRLILPHASVSIPADARLEPCMEGFFASHQPVLLSISGLEPEYDLPLQIRVLGLVRRSYPQAGLMIIGWGSLEAELRRLIFEQPEREHIVLCGDVPHGTTLVALRRSAVLLRTTHYDGDAISVREALELGTPVIATDNGMRPEGVVLVPASNLNRLHEAIESCLRDGDGKKNLSLGQSGEQNMASVLKLYQELLSQRSLGDR